MMFLDIKRSSSGIRSHRRSMLLSCGILVPVLLLLQVGSTVSFTTTPFLLTRTRTRLIPISISTSTNSRSSTRRTQLYAALPEGYQEFGEFLIRKAGKECCGITNEDDLTIEWKAGRIIVTVHGKVFVSTVKDEGDDDDDDIDIDIDIDEDEDNMSGLSTDEDEVSASESSTTETTGIDVTALARAINAALDDDGTGLLIAEVHEIEVTTPGASDEIQGSIMFDAYKGFDVICQQQDLKSKKIKRLEGKLVERNDDFTIINIKGRMKKMKNDSVLSVKLPKAKSEKGRKKR